MMKPFILGIAGGTGSGKTTLADTIRNTFSAGYVSIIDCDAYYRDLSHLPLDQRHTINFDHPDAVDAALLQNHLKLLKNGKPVNKHIYDYKTHTRKPETVLIMPKPVVILEGVLILAIRDIVELCDYRVFIDEDPDLRLLRRMIRDIKQRGRNIDSIARQYLDHVKPMYDRFVEPSKSKADIVLKNNGADAEKLFQIIETRVQQQQHDG